MGRKRFKQNVVQLADQVAGPSEMALDEIPPPRDRILTVSIRRSGETYSCEIHRVVNGFPRSKTFPIAWRSADFERELQSMAEIAKQLSVPGPIGQEKLQAVAALGKVLFKAIFSTDEAQQIIRSVCESEDRHTILFYTDQFAMCWPLLYLGNDLKRIDAGLFLGMSATIIRSLVSCVNEPSQNYREDSPVGSRVQLNYAWDKSLNEVREREMPYIVGLPQHLDEARISVLEVPALHPNGDAALQVPALFVDLNLEDPSIIHLSCHYEAGASLSSTRFQLRDGAFITYLMMHASDVAFTSTPLLFFNACDVASLRPDQAENFLEYCMRIGAECVIAPEFQVHDVGAADVAEVFYRLLLKDGLSVCDALRATKLWLWREKGSLAGLLYAVYGQSDRSFR
jgi:hypothetical protein